MEFFRLGLDYDRRLPALLQAVMLPAALNIWTGAPLLAVWVGSRTVTSSQLTMGSVFLVIVVLWGLVTRKSGGDS